MKKITILFFFMVAFASKNYAQCTFTTMAPSSTIVANNSGAVQNISTFTFAKNYAKLSNMIVGGKYTFNCTAGTVGKYLTITDLTNNVIAFGASPLTVENVTSSDIKVHYYETVACGTNWSTLAVSFQYVLPTCPSSTNLAVNNITTSGASFTWTPGAGVTAWEVLVLESTDPAPTAATSGTTVTTTPTYVATDLDPATSYKFYVRSNCTTEFGVWGIPLQFATVCPPTTLFNENFDTTPVTKLPICWSSIIRGTTIAPDAYIGVENFDAYSGTNAMQLFKFTSSEDSDFILVSPNLANLSSGTHRLKFYAHYNGLATIEVGTLNNTTNTALFTSFQNVELSESYLEYTVDFAEYAGEDTYIGIRISSGTSVFIDDIRWEQTPGCTDVSDVTLNTTTPTTATLSWESNGAETLWDVVYGSSTETDPNTLTPISPAPNNPTATITGLTANTTYNTWVRSVCDSSGEDNGTWIGPITFTTACIATADFNENFDGVTTPTLPTCWTAILSGSTLSTYASVGTVNYNAVSGSNSVLLRNHNSGILDNIILVSPNLNTLSLGNHRLRFYAKSSTAEATLQVGTLTNNNTDSAIFTLLEPVSITNTYAEYTIDFTSYSGTDTYIGLRNASSVQTDLFVDSIRWEPIPLCADVTEITISDITAATATAAWFDQGAEVSYQVVYGDVAVTDPNTLTPSTVISDPTFTLTGLAADASYNVWVRSVCTSGNGSWIGPVTFNAQCSAMATLSENFDTTANQALPNCWSAVLYGNTLAPNAYAYTVNYNGYSGVNSFRMNNYTSGPENTIMLIAPSLSTLTTATPYSLKFYGRSDSGTATVVIGTTDTNTSSAVFTAFQEIVLTSTYQEYTVNFATYTGSNTYIALKNACLTQYAPVNLDNIRWESNLATTTFDAAQFNFYPNPSSDKITVRLAHTTENLESVTLYDMVGKSVLKTTNIASNQATLDVSNLAKGIYLVEINTANQIKMTKKLIVK